MKFSNQIKALIGDLTFTTGELNNISQYLQDGVVEVINRISTINPTESIKFAITESTTGSDGIRVRGKIMSVVRAHDSTTILRPCQIMDPAFRYEATDVDSFNYRSAYNPAYYILDGKVQVVPAPESDSALHVTHIYYDDAVSYEESTISNFPPEFIYIVVLFAALRTILYKLSDKDNLLPNVILPSPPTAISIDSNFLQDNIDTPNFTSPIMQLPNWADVDKWISDEEDSEMSAARIQDINTRISEFGAKMQDAQAIFNEQNTAMQKELQIALKNTDLRESEEGRKLQKFQLDTQLYVNEVQEKIQEFQSDFGIVSKQYEWLQGRYLTLKEDYENAFGVIAAPMQREKKAGQQQAIERT